MPGYPSRVARLVVHADHLVVRLSPVEKLAAWVTRSPTAPLTSVRRVEVVRRPGRVRLDVDFGFAGNTAPAAGLITAHSRGRYAGGRAAVFVYFGLSAVRVDLDDARWSLFLISTRRSQSVAEQLQEAVARQAQPER